MSSTEFLLGFNEFSWFLPDLTGFLLGFNRDVLGFTGFSLVLLGFEEFD